MRSALLLLGGLALPSVLACRKSQDARPEAGARSAEPAPADSLVATAAGGVEVWFTLARKDQAPDGHYCIDRAIEIRRNGSRVTVPLLYTSKPPEVVNDTTLRAWLSSRCSPGDAYLVDLRSGRPVKEPT